MSAKQLLLETLKPYYRRILIAATALVLASCITLYFGHAIKIAVDTSSLENAHALNNAMFKLCGLVILLALVVYTRFYHVSWLGERISNDLRQSLLRHLLSIEASYFSHQKTGELVSRITTDTTIIQTTVGSSLSMALRSVLNLFGALVLLFITDWQMSLWVLGALTLILLPIRLFSRNLRSLARQNQDRVADIGAAASDAISHIKTVQGFNQEQRESQRLENITEAAFDSAKERIHHRAKLIAIVMSGVGLAMITFIWFGFDRVNAGLMTSGALASFGFYAIMAGNAAAMLSEVSSDLQRMLGASERISELLKIQPAINDDNSQALPLHAPYIIQFHNVSFAYPNSPDKPVLSNINFTLNAEQNIALVGPSGAGKSTIIDLLRRFIEPTDGLITINNLDYRHYPIASLRKLFATVDQSGALFHNTIRFNVTYGSPSQRSDDEIWAALGDAQAQEFVEPLPEQLNQLIGERGTKLSGGQQQRLCLARAFLTERPILILDEATSALDTKNERLIQEALKAQPPGQSRITIAHRLSTIIEADLILVLDHGRVEQQGTHQDLLTQSDLYRNLWQQQSVG